MSLSDSVLQGNRLALSRLLTQIENDTPEGREDLNFLFPYTGKAHLIGVTGAPGTGKSSLVNQLVLLIRSYEKIPLEIFQSQRNPYVAVVAVDPSSPFSGGAILGDRVRMRDLSGDPGVFIRSMASRGSLGGLANTTSGVVQALDAAGFRIIIIETVGAGQAEVDIARMAHTTIVIEVPGLGDDIQAIKAGILEIADILVINKADRPGIENTERALRSMLHLGHPLPRTLLHHGMVVNVESKVGVGDSNKIWLPPLHKTNALDGVGIEELLIQLNSHYQFLQQSGQWREREEERLRSELDNLLNDTLISRWRSRIPETEYKRILSELVSRSISPWQAVELLLDGCKP